METLRLVLKRLACTDTDGTAATNTEHYDTRNAGNDLICAVFVTRTGAGQRDNFIHFSLWALSYRKSFTPELGTFTGTRRNQSLNLGKIFQPQESLFSGGRTVITINLRLSGWGLQH